MEDHTAKALRDAEAQQRRQIDALDRLRTLRRLVARRSVGLPTPERLRKLAELDRLIGRVEAQVAATQERIVALELRRTPADSR